MHELRVGNTHGQPGYLGARALAEVVRPLDRPIRYWCVLKPPSSNLIVAVGRGGRE
jgi:hypothetical protein